MQGDMAGDMLENFLETGSLCRMTCAFEGTAAWGSDIP